MDGVRTALRLGAENAYLVYRRSEVEMPARNEEIEHAKEEGIELKLLTNPVEIIGKDGWVNKIRCIKMKLGEPDESGRRRPIPIGGSEYQIEVDTVIMAVGSRANPLFTKQTEGLKLNRWGYIEVNEKMQSSLPYLFAGGDIVTGSATVISAMGAGKIAAYGIHDYLQNYES